MNAIDKYVSAMRWEYKEYEKSPHPMANRWMLINSANGYEGIAGQVCIEGVKFLASFNVGYGYMQRVFTDLEQAKAWVVESIREGESRKAVQRESLVDFKGVGNAN